MRGKRGLRVVQIDFGFKWPACGGQQMRVFKEIESLKKEDFDVRLMAPDFESGNLRDFNVVPISYFVTPNRITLRSRIFPVHRKIKNSLLRGMKTLRPDIIHHHFGAKKYIINSIIAATQLKIPQVTTLHQFWPLCYRGTYWDFERNICEEKNLCGECMLTIPLIKKCLNQRWRKMAKRIMDEICHYILYSKFMKSKLEDVGIDAERTTVIPFGVDFENIGGINKKREYVVFSGRTSREKGVDLYLRALSLVKKSCFEAIIIGDGAQRREYEDIASKIGVAVKFKGWINDRRQYFEYFKNAICVVVPSLWIENSPLVIGEAFACETPVIGTNSGGIPELINDSGAGFVVERDADEIAEKIRILVEDTKLRDEMGEKGRAYAEKHFNWEKNVEKLVEVYEKVLDEHGK